MSNPLKAELFTWIASYPKSGNTYLRLLLQAYRTNGVLDINDVTSTVGDNTSFWFQNVSPLALNKLTFATRLLLRPAALLNQLNSINTRMRLIKTHNANAAINGLPHLIPGELTQRAVYIVRDPRDVVTSLQGYMNAGGMTIEEAAEKMANEDYCIQSEDELPQVVTSWSKHVNSWMGEERYPLAILKYEDLCADPAGELKQVLEFCEIEVDEDRIAVAVEACRIDRLHRQEKDNGFREDRRETSGVPFFHKGGSRWRDELPEHIARKIEADHREVMLKFDYLEGVRAVG